MGINCLKENITNQLHRREEIVFSYLFGSFAQGREGPLSDIDIAVYTENPKESKYGYKAELVSELTKELNVNVDLTILKEGSNFLAFQIIKTGELLFCKDNNKLHRFHYLVVRDYLDFKPVLENISTNKAGAPLVRTF